LVAAKEKTGTGDDGKQYRERTKNDIKELREKNKGNATQRRRAKRTRFCMNQAGMAKGCG
jgi:hypothetical protein